ncbi:MAG: hypothetical protein K2W95_32630 [Candidatus Obscuribacterales bacterium]|nr:hypothetical protein [Candidatus Obscuribacterales bacterium]
MAVPHGDLQSYQATDNAARTADGSHGDLSAQMWDGMRQNALGGLPRENQPSSGYLDFDSNIYGTGDSVVSANEPREAEPLSCPEDPPQPHGQQLNFLKDLNDYADKNFDRVDADKDGFLSEEEFETALKDQCLRGEDRKAVELMQKHQNEIEERSNDEFGDENNGVTRADLKEFRDLSERYEDASDMSIYGKQKFDSADTDKDGFLSASELGKAIDNAAENSDDKKVLEKMRSDYERLQGASNDEWGFDNSGISKDDLLENAMSEAVGWDDTGFMMDVSSDLMRHWLDKQEKEFPSLRKRPG